MNEQTILTVFLIVMTPPAIAIFVCLAAAAGRRAAQRDYKPGVDAELAKLKKAIHELKEVMEERSRLLRGDRE